MYKTNSSAGGLLEVHTWDPRLWINCWMGRFWKKWFFDQWGMGLGMFWWSNRPTLLNLSLIYKILEICEKKLSTLSTGNLPSVTTLIPFTGNSGKIMIRIYPIYSQYICIQNVLNGVNAGCPRIKYQIVLRNVKKRLWKASLKGNYWPQPQFPFYRYPHI